MSIQPGQSLLHYELTEQIGEGGMGVVWRGRDTKLDRDVAIKILPDDFAQNPDRLARFSREAKLLASLNHANIATIHGLEQDAGVHFLAMELVEGEDLAARIQRGAIPIEEALPLALQIASALEAAHERGVIHRDLKPPNLKITPEGNVKVLDFGLAKAFGPDAQDPMTSPTMSPTVTSVGSTAIGVILGTAAYMSPEQAKGKPVDRRADIWSFGVVLLEMLTGRLLFRGESVSETIAAVLMAEPDLSGLPVNTPPKVRRLIERCLRKDPQSRLRDIGDARVVVEEALAGREWENLTTATETPAGRRAVLPWILVAALAVPAGLFVMKLLQPAPRPAPEFFSITPPNNISDVIPEPAVSPDGDSVAFVAPNDDGVTMLWVRSFGSASSRAFPGTEWGFSPFWSRDSQSIGFERGEKLYRLDLADGTVQQMAEAALGGAWNADDRVLFSSLATSGRAELAEVSASGGSVTLLKQTESVGPFQIYPRFLPDGNHFLFVGGPNYYESHLHLGSLDPPEVRRIGDIRSRAEYVNGYLLYGDDGTLLAQRFDVENAELLGQPVRVAQGMGIGHQTRHNPSFSVSENTLVFAGGSPDPETQLTWTDRQGSRVETSIPWGMVAGFALSPDETTIAFERADPVTYRNSVWTADLSKGSRILLRDDPNDDTGCPLWSPNGKRVLTTTWGNYSITDVATGEIEELPCGNACLGWPLDWPTGGTQVVARVSPNDVWIVPLTGGEPPVPLLDSPAKEIGAAVSGDGQWIAYASDESGEFEVYVQSFPDLGGKIRVSPDGGWMPVWREDDRELYYVRSTDKMLMAVKINSDGSGLTISTPQELFQMTRIKRDSKRGQYAALDNGERFIFNELADVPVSRSIHVIRNWQSLLEEE